MMAIQIRNLKNRARQNLATKQKLRANPLTLTGTSLRRSRNNNNNNNNKRSTEQLTFMVKRIYILNCKYELHSKSKPIRSNAISPMRQQRRNAYINFTGPLAQLRRD